MSFNYMTVDMDKIKEKRSKRYYSVPYHRLLDPNKEDDRKNMVEFFRKNDVVLYQNMGASDIDYNVFVGCMEIYQNTGVNYFYDFADLRLGFQYTTLDKGIKGYNRTWDGISIFDENYLTMYLEEVSRTIELMQFFNIDDLYGTKVYQYQKFYNNAEKEWTELKKYELDKRQESQKAKVEIFEYEYFNFDEFDNRKFTKIYEECIKDLDMGKNLYSFNDVLNINVQLENNKTFIVFLRKNSKVCFVGKTTNLLTYIGAKNKEYDAESVAFYPVDNKYIEEVYVKALIEFDLGYSGAVKLSNRKYISLTTAKRVFKELYKINLTHIKKIISKYDIQKFILGDTIVVDKIELDRCTRDYLNLGSK